MPELTPEERQKMYAEERAKVEAQNKTKAKQLKKNLGSGTILRASWTCLSLCSFLAIIVAPVYSTEGSPHKPNLSVKLTGGLGSVPIGDMNAILVSFNNMPRFQEWRANYPDLISGGIKTLNNRILDLQLEFRLDIGPTVGLAVGTSLPYQKRNESTIDWTMLVGQRHIYTLRPEIQVAPPLLCSAYFGLLSSSKLSAHLFVGWGLYTARMSEYYRLEVLAPGSAPNWGVRYWKSNFSSSVGVHTGLELDYHFTNTWSLVLEAQVRHARIGAFSGKQYWEGEPWGITRRENGTIYYYTRLEFYVGDRYADVQVMAPSGDPIEFPRDIRKATLNLSGFSFRIGIKFGLFPGGD